MQKTQAPPEFLTLPQVIPTVGTSCLTILLVNTLSLAVCFPSLSPSLGIEHGKGFGTEGARAAEVRGIFGVTFSRTWKAGVRRT